MAQCQDVRLAQLYFEDICGSGPWFRPQLSTQRAVAALIETPADQDARAIFYH
jgi:hypothetical protein